MLNKNLNFTFNHKDQPDKLYSIMSSTEIKVNFDKRAEELRTYLYSLIDTLSVAGAINLGYDATKTIKAKIDEVVTSLNTVTTEVINGRLGKVSLSTILNEFNTSINGLKSLLGSVTLTTTDKTVTGALNELKNTDDAILSRLGTSYLITTNNTIGEAINELKSMQNSFETALGGKANNMHSHTKAQITNFPINLSEFVDDIGHNHANKLVLDNINQAKYNEWESKTSRTEHDNLVYRVEDVESMSSNNENNIGSIQTELSDARLGYSTLKNKILNMDSKTETNTTQIAEIVQQQATDLSLSGTTLKLKKADGTTLGVGITLPSGGEGHTHSNKNVLDGITQEKVTQWDNNSGGSGSSYINNDFSFNADVLLDITTFDGGNEAMHPKALYFEEGFGGYKFWLAYSPYTDWSELVETPCIACSQDGVNWETPKGVTNPLDKFDSVATTFLSDPHLVYNSTTKYLEIWYRENVRGISEKIWRRKSLDGKTWTEKELLITIPSTSNKMFVSPSVIYEDSKYKIWGSKEIAAAKRVLTYYESTDGTNWNLIRDIDFGKQSTELGYQISHFDIIHTSVGYELIAQETTDDLRYIIYMNSQDNITYGNFKLLMERRPTGYKYFDDDRMYRPCIMKVKEDYWCYYSASCKQPIGGFASDREWKTGVVVFGKSILNADKVTKGIYDRKLNDLKSSYKANKSLEIANQVNDKVAVNIKTISQFLYEDSGFVKENNCLYVVLDTNKAFKYFDYYYGQTTGGGGTPETPSSLTTENLQVHYDVTKSTISSTQINDLTTNNNHGLLKNFTVTPTTAGIVFSTNQHIELTNSIIFGASDYTIELFANLPAQSDGNIFCKRYSASNNVTTSISSTTTPTLTNRIAGLENGTTTSRSLSTAYTTFIKDVWSHIVFVKTGTQVEIWINGVKVSNVNGGYLMKLDETTTAKSYIGTSLGTGSFLKGTMKSFRYYDKALSETEIKNNYNYEIG